MTQEKIKEMQARVGAVADGFWGPRSMAACQAHLRGMMPRPNPWPVASEEGLTRFYGQAGDESHLVALPVAGLGLRYAGKEVRTVRCHAKVSASLLRILAELSVSFPEVVAQYAGCYANRAMRGGTRPSLHARGAAIDLAAGTNGNLTPWPVRATMPLRVMEVFAKEGWLSAGAFWGRDAMHCQATR